MCRDYPTLAHEHRCLRGVFLGFGAVVWTGELLCDVVAPLAALVT